VERGSEKDGRGQGEGKGCACCPLRYRSGVACLGGNGADWERAGMRMRECIFQNRTTGIGRTRIFGIPGYFVGSDQSCFVIE
jgi:hypothetical protein